MPSLFHYTTNDGAIGIIESDCLFATHCNYLNDTGELEVIRDIVTPIFEKEFKEEAQKYIKSGQLREEYLRQHGEAGYLKEAQILFEISQQVTNETTPIFVASFCRHSTETEQYRDGLLSQWRGYGAQGGCAVEFDEEELQHLIARESQRFAYSHVSLKDIIYDNHQSAVDIRDIEGVAASIMRHMFEQSSESKSLHEQRSNRSYKVFASTAATLKYSGFREEQEVRIIAPVMRGEAAREFPSRIPKCIFYRSRNGLPIPYVKLFDNFGNLPITRIIVGPQRYQDKVVYALQLALEGKGLRVEVTKSSIGFLP